MIQSLSCKETTGIDFLDNTEHYNEKKIQQFIQGHVQIYCCIFLVI